MEILINKYLKKGRYTIYKLLASLIMSILISILFCIYKGNVIIDRIILLSIFNMFVFIHFIFDIKTIYDFIYKKRYIIAIVALAFVMIMQYSGSSIGMYNDVIQPNCDEKYFSPILGEARNIRSDEWIVNTTIALSQNYENEFDYYNDLLRGTATDVFSTVNVPVKDILILCKPFAAGYLIFGKAAGLSFWWYGRLFALMLVSFELCMLISNKKKLPSLLGMLLITFSSAVQWWYSQAITEILIYGQLTLILINIFMNTENIRKKILCGFGLIISVGGYIFTFYPAWQVPFAYIFFALFIWLFIKNYKNYKSRYMKKSDFFIIGATVVILALFGIRYLFLSFETIKIIMNTDYPGARFEIGGGAKNVLFSYVYSFLFAYKTVENPCEWSGMLSLFPMPMIVGAIYLIRNKFKNKSFLIPILLVGLVFSVFCLHATNRLFAKITLLYMVPATRLAVPLGLLQIYIMVFLLANTFEKDKIINKNLSLIVSFVISVLCLSIAINTAPQQYMGSLLGYVCGSFLMISIYMLFNIQKEQIKKYFVIFLSIIAFIGGIRVNPIQKGISVVTGKPLAKEIERIVGEDSENNLWLVEGITLNYAIANGAKVINSTNIYPNKDLFIKLLGEEACELEENRVIYNRYAHILLSFTDENTNISLISQDVILIKMNYNDIQKLNVKYILSCRNDLEDNNSENITFKKIYEEDGCNIYRINY